MVRKMEMVRRYSDTPHFRRRTAALPCLLQIKLQAFLGHERPAGLLSGRNGTLGLLQKAAHGVRRLGAAVDPMLGAVELDHHIVILLKGVVVAENFEETSITLEALVSGNNTEERTVFRAFAAESENDHGWMRDLV